MKREDALTLSEYLESERTTHTLRFIPNYGYVVRIPEEAMTEQIRNDIKHLAGKEPIHGVEYR